MMDLSVFVEIAQMAGIHNENYVVPPPTQGTGEVEKEALPAPDLLMMDDLAFAFEERAAILEYDGGYPREEAERLVRLEIYG